ncbi:carbon-nitrogen hydrolase family protein [Halovenus rubra]|uniref:Carbon-nitrogen hydrolase family protein n=2 Tax=Halovenus rubra TaxID=869890 RepID=A0ACC7DYL4_9EURY|nr:carbon-nitrogen hydrolase family protein [Halovenus rubra]
MVTITVCELPDFEAQSFETQFDALVEHTRSHDSDIVVLPEMPFSPWLAASKPSDSVDTAWADAEITHEQWQDKLDAFETTTVVYSRPATRDGRRVNEGVIRTHDQTRGVHLKHYLPDEPGFWEATWYEAGGQEFEPVACAGIKSGLLVCTDLWASNEIREYAQADVGLLINPRVTERRTTEKWLAGSQTMGVLAGAYLASSNRAGAADGVTFGGNGWVISPDGSVLARTDSDHPFATTEIDPDIAESAKSTYPRDALGRAGE